MIFALPSDLIGADETITASGASVESDYPLSNLHDGKPTEVTYFDSNVQTRIVWDAGSAVSVEGLMIVMHTFAAGATLKVQANASDSWGSPSFSQDVTVPAWPDHLPSNITVDLRGTLIDTTGYRYRSLLIPAQTPNHGIGEILWITQWRQTVKAPFWPLRRFDRRQVHVNRTNHGVEHVVERGVRQRRLLPTFGVISDADRALLLRLIRDANGAELGWPVIVNPDTISTDEHFYVRFNPESAAEFEEQLTLPGINTVSLDLLEIQRGRPL